MHAHFREHHGDLCGHHGASSGDARGGSSECGGILLCRIALADGGGGVESHQFHDEQRGTTQRNRAVSPCLGPPHGLLVVNHGGGAFHRGMALGGRNQRDIACGQWSCPDLTGDHQLRSKDFQLSCVCGPHHDAGDAVDPFRRWQCAGRRGEHARVFRHRAAHADTPEHGGDWADADGSHRGRAWSGGIHRFFCACSRECSGCGGEHHVYGELWKCECGCDVPGSASRGLQRPCSERRL